METFFALLAIWVGNPGEFPTQRPVTRSFDVYFDLRPNKRLSKQSWGWWFETPSRPLWRHRYAIFHFGVIIYPGPQHDVVWLICDSKRDRGKCITKFEAKRICWFLERLYHWWRGNVSKWQLLPPQCRQKRTLTFWVRIRRVTLHVLDNSSQPGGTQLMYEHYFHSANLYAPNHFVVKMGMEGW